MSADNTIATYVRKPVRVPEALHAAVALPGEARTIGEVVVKPEVHGIRDGAKGF